MSVVNDATSHARAALARADAVVADLERRLAARPGWLRVGPPARHADAADRADAEDAAALAERLERARRARAAFAARVEGALGEPPPGIYAFVAYSRQLAHLSAAGDVDALLDAVEPSPERLLTEAPRMPREKAMAILAFVRANGGRVGDGETFRRSVPLDAADLADLQALGWRLHAGPDPAPGWSVLLPVRLETRFLRPGAEIPGRPSPDASVFRLLVRVEPDAPAIAQPAPPVQPEEADLVAACWSACGGSLEGSDGEAAFLKLAGHVGPARADYLLRTVPVLRDGEAFRPSEPPETLGDRRPAPEPLIALPDTIEIWAGPEDAPARLATLHPNREAMARQAGLDAVAGSEDGETPRLWWNSFAAAEAVGIATEIPLGAAAPAFPVLFCIGYDAAPAAAPAAAFEALADSGRLGLLAPLTPTNTVAGAPTADLGEDARAWLAGARGAPGTAGTGAVAGALAGRSALPGLLPADGRLGASATTVVQALWPVLWQRALKDVAGAGEPIWRLGEWAVRNLHPFGPFPVLRVDDLPYGLLPVGDFRRWIWRAPVRNQRGGDPDIERLLLATLPALSEPLRSRAEGLGTAAGADAGRILELLEQVPTSRAYGSRQLPPTILLDGLLAAVGRSAPGDQMRLWEAAFAALRARWPDGPQRRYSPLLDVEPLPDEVDPEIRGALHAYLDTTWALLAMHDDLHEAWAPEGLPPHALARLVRQSLLLTQAEVSRLDPRQGPGFLVPLDRASTFDDLASGRRDDMTSVRELPRWAPLLVAHHGDDPRAALVLRQFEDVRAATDRLIDEEAEPVLRALPAVLDLSSHRVDAWWTGLALRRLRSLEAGGATPALGCYGWVDDLAPSPDPTPPTQAGLLHAPGYAQAVTAALLRDQAVRQPGVQHWDITLDSRGIRLAASLAEQVRAGMHLAEALGREIERRVGEPGKVIEIRKAFPARPEWTGRRVCDGMKVLDAAAEALPAGIDRRAFDDLRDALDTYADLLVADAMHDVVSGRAAAAAEALEAAAGLGPPPELRLLRTEREGGTVATSVAVALPWLAAWDQPDPDEASPLRIADPALAGLLEATAPPPALPRAEEWTWTADGAVVTLADLGIAVAEVPLWEAAALDALVRLVLGPGELGGTAAGLHARCRAICAALGAPEPAPGGAKDLRARLGRLRALATSDVAALAAPGAGPARARAWGIGETPAVAAEVLADRLATIGQADNDETSAVVLAERIRALLAPAMPLPLALPRPRAQADRALEREWLDLMAAVRPAIAHLDVVQLSLPAPWTGSRSDGPSVWSHVRLDDGEQVRLAVVFRPPAPPGADPAVEAVVPIDSWAETIPAARHTTWAAFGYDAPRARPPQAILLAVPADVDAPDPPTDIRGAVLEARRLARMRAAPPPGAEELALALPCGLVPAGTTPAGAILTRRP